VVLEFMADDETARGDLPPCRLGGPAPDFAGLLACSVVAGTSRGVLRMEEPAPLEDD
jgi:hypothetical protein